MVREDLVSSAVSFLQDPTVSNAPIEKRIEFLRSKNLTQDEIDASLARASTSASQQLRSSPAPSSTYGNAQYARPPPGYDAYPPPGYWQQASPPELPRRDWRDWFIMATVLGGVGYGLAFTAKRYILPLIKPPTPPQLEQDKASVDNAFDRAFSLIEQLTTDTAALKASEEARTERLDTALQDFEAVVESLKNSSQRRDVEAQRMESDVRSLRDDVLPKAMEAHKDMTDTRLRELGNELKSLKTLIGNRMNNGNGSAAGITPQPSNGAESLPSAQNSAHVSTPPNFPNGWAHNSVQQQPSPSSSGAPAEDLYRRLTSNRSGIPAWQMAAASKNRAASPIASSQSSNSMPLAPSGATEEPKKTDVEETPSSKPASVGSS